MAESKGAIAVAAGANIAIAIAKFIGAGLTGSSAMLSEGVHSLVDTANQGLLLIGLVRARKKADSRHPFGYGREVYFYSFVVALLIFFAGGLYSVQEGISKLAHPAETRDAILFGFHVPGMAINFSVLALALIAEGYSLSVALRSLPVRSRWSPFSAIQRSKDPSLFVVIAEDAAAVTGLAIAALGLALTYISNNAAFDAIASIAIGAVLIGMAGLLIVETHGLLIGEAADPDVTASIMSLLAAEPLVRNVNEILTQHLGPSDILVNLSIDVANDSLGGQLEHLTSRLDREIKARNKRVKRVFLEFQASDASLSRARKPIA